MLANENSGQLIFVKGDVLKPQGGGKQCIAHSCNDEGRWGAGFVLNLSRKWIEPERQYKVWARWGIELGKVQLVSVEDNILVANLIAQKGIRRKNSDPPSVDYDALRSCLETLDKMLDEDVSIHMPKIGCGLGGGSWSEVEKIIRETLPERKVYVYTLVWKQQQRRKH